MGLGPIGSAIARLAATRPELLLVGAIDADPGKIGRDVGDVIGLNRTLGLPVIGAPPVEGAAVVLHATRSRLADVTPELEALVATGVHVVSTCEELAFPFSRPELAGRLDSAARSAGRAIIGTGVNPGFVMDALPVFLSGACAVVRHVSALRVVDTSRRRRQLQEKTGAGLTPDAFREQVSIGRIRHVGLPESTWLIAVALGWELDDVAETIEPVIAERTVASSAVVVEPGYAAGVRQVCVGRISGRELIRLELQMALEVDAPRDEIVLDADPPIRLLIPGGIFGDTATAAIVVNAASRVSGLGAGLFTVLDLPPGSAIGEGATSYGARAADEAS